MESFSILLFLLLPPLNIMLVELITLLDVNTVHSFFTFLLHC